MTDVRNGLDSFNVTVAKLVDGTILVGHIFDEDYPESHFVIQYPMTLNPRDVYPEQLVLDSMIADDIIFLRSSAIIYQFPPCSQLLNNYIKKVQDIIKRQRERGIIL